MAHLHKDIDFTASVFIVLSGRVLLHTHKKYGTLLPPGGHIELTEDPNEAAIREVKEECGLSITLISPREAPRNLGEKGLKELIEPFYFNIHEAAPGHRHSDFVYFATSESGIVVPEHADDGWQWWSKPELEAHTTLWPSVRFYALAAIDEVAKRELQ